MVLETQVMQGQSLLPIVTLMLGQPLSNCYLIRQNLPVFIAECVVLNCTGYPFGLSGTPVLAVSSPSFLLTLSLLSTAE